MTPALSRVSAMSPTPELVGMVTRTRSPPSPANGWNSAIRKASPASTTAATATRRTLIASPARRGVQVGLQQVGGSARVLGRAPGCALRQLGREALVVGLHRDREHAAEPLGKAPCLRR